MHLADIMTTHVTTIHADAPADEAWAYLQQKGFRHLVVVRGDKIVGVVSDRDLGGKRGGAQRRDKAVAEVMTGNIVTARPNATVKEAAKQMRGKGIGCLPIVDQGTLVGIVTTADLLDLLAQGVKTKEPRQKRGKKKVYTGPLPGAPRV
ncbi:MAG: CBS domain-containing protein [Planctomycetota bacterium]|jgi:acetoin utilization protein AcuB